MPSPQGSGIDRRTFVRRAAGVAAAGTLAATGAYGAWQARQSATGTYWGVGAVGGPVERGLPSYQSGGAPTGSSWPPRRT